MRRRGVFGQARRPGWQPPQGWTFVLARSDSCVAIAAERLITGNVQQRGTQRCRFTLPETAFETRLGTDPQRLSRSEARSALPGQLYVPASEVARILRQRDQTVSLQISYILADCRLFHHHPRRKIPYRRRLAPPRLDLATIPNRPRF